MRRSARAAPLLCLLSRASRPDFAGPGCRGFYFCPSLPAPRTGGRSQFANSERANRTYGFNAAPRATPPGRFGFRALLLLPCAPRGRRLSPRPLSQGPRLYSSTKFFKEHRALHLPAVARFSKTNDSTVLFIVNSTVLNFSAKENPAKWPGFWAVGEAGRGLALSHTGAL